MMDGAGYPFAIMSFKPFQPPIKAPDMTNDAPPHDDETIPGAAEIALAQANEEAEEEELSSSSAVDKRAKFKELASKRVTSILDGYRILGKLANSSAYPYTQEDIDKIFGRLEGDLAELKEDFQPKKVKDTTFVL